MYREKLKATALRAMATIAILFACLTASAKTYTVQYAGLPSGTTGGFRIVDTDPFKTGETYTGYFSTYNVYNQISSTDKSSDLIISAYYKAASGIKFSLDDNSYCISITSDNYSNYITPNTVDGYELSGVSVDETNLVITITYSNKNSKLITWSDGVFTYSNYHIQSTSNQGYMDETFDYYPGKPEIAISLNLNKSKSSEDYISYKKYCFGTESTDGGISVYYYADKVDGQWDYYRYNSTDDTYEYPLNGSGYRLSGGTSTALDDDGEGVATYVYQSDKSETLLSSADETVTIGSNTFNVYYETLVYKRTHDVAYSDVTTITIPKEVTHDGVTYAVTAIQKWGFAYGESDLNVYKRCDDYDATDESLKDVKHYKDYPGTDTYDNINDHSNDYLQTVRFEDMSNVHSIGDYAFMTCKKLTSIVIPASVTYFGSGLFECDKALTDCRFQTLTDSYVSYLKGLETDASTKDEATVPVTDALIGQVRWHTLRNFTFWFCTGMKSLELPDGITEIKGTSFGASMQYMTSLINLRLPNTLTTIGPHFLCSAISIETLTIPASVTYIDGACFHGCENLTSVYLLGPAATLKATTAAGETFGENSPFCAEHVNNCTFYTTNDYLSGYESDGTWSTIDNNGEWDPANGEYANYLKVMPAETRTFPMKWVTALFPKGVTNYKSEFGEDTKVAVMDYATKGTGTDPSQGGKTITMYNITFKLISGDDIPANTPVMIKAGKQTNFQLYQLSDEQDATWKSESTKDHATTITVDEDGTEISMKGRYLSWMLTPWDYYFMYKDKVVASDGTITYPENPAKFYRVADQAEAPYVGPCRCYWTIAVNGTKTNALTTAKQGFFTGTDETTGITTPENIRINVSGIYDLNGRKLDIPEDELPQGMYIVNGKKIVKK